MSRAAGLAIESERVAARLTQEQLWTAAGISKATYLRIADGSRPVRINVLAALAAALGLEPHELIERAEQILAREQRRTTASPDRTSYDLAAKHIPWDDIEAEQEAPDTP